MNVITLPVQFVPRNPAFIAEYGPDQPMVDEHGKPRTWDDGEPGCTEIVMVPWPNKFTEWADSPANFTIARGWQLYAHEWMMRRGQDVRRFGICVRHLSDFFGWGMDPTKINVAAGKRYEDQRMAAGVCALTVEKELRMHLAAMSHNFKRERIEKVPFLEMPEGQPRERRPLTEDEFAALMRLPLSHRQRMFWRVAYWTGHRARAIETLKWNRVHFGTRTIDFNEPGARKTNKRRADGFPIPEKLFAILEAAKARRDARFPDDDYVIGCSSPGFSGSTYRHCKANLKAIGVKEFGLCRHAIRKLFCTSRIAAGQSESLVAALIADNPATMRKSYVKLNTEQLRAAAENREAA